MAEENETPPMTRSRIRVYRDCLLPTFVSAALALFVPTAWSLVFAPAPYAGVQDESVSASAQERYQPFLLDVLASMAKVALSELVLLTVALLGLSLLWATSAPRPVEPRRRVWARHLAAASLVTATWFGWVADRHPGLFLSTLSGSALAYPLLAVARYLAPALALASIAGYVFGIARGPRRLQIGIGVLVALVIAGVFWRNRLARAHVHEPYRASVPSKEAKEAKAKPPSAGAAVVDRAAPRKKAAKPSILWIGVDSLRPDKIDETHTPNLARLVAESVYFPNTLVTVPRTGPSWVATLTSMSPLTNGVETMFPDARAGRLSQIGMPAHLAARGFRTAVFSDYAGEFFGRVDLGFQLRSVPEVELREISGQILLAKAPLVLAQVGVIYSSGPFERSLLGDPIVTLVRGLTSFTHPPVLAGDLAAWLQEDNTAPYFGLVFYSQPHFPYASNGPWYRKYHVSGSSSSLAFGRDVANETPITSSEDIRQVDALYRGALAESDAAIGKLLARLEATGQLADTIIVMTADHGEGLYECPTCVGHGDNLRGMFTLRTPLAIRLPRERYPNGGGRVVETHVSQLDIYPTLLSLVGERPVAIHEGIALLDARGGSVETPRDRVLFAETGEWLWPTAAVPEDRLEYPPITGMAKLEQGRIVIDRKYYPVIRSAKQRAAVRWPYKLTYEPRKSAVVYRLYKLDDDPFEERDVAAEQPQIAEELKRQLRLDVLRHPDVMSVRDYFVSRPLPEEE